MHQHVLHCTFASLWACPLTESQLCCSVGQGWVQVWVYIGINSSSSASNKSHLTKPISKSDVQNIQETAENNPATSSNYSCSRAFIHITCSSSASLAFSTAAPKVKNALILQHQKKTTLSRLVMRLWAPGLKCYFPALLFYFNFLITPSGSADATVAVGTDASGC